MFGLTHFEPKKCTFIDVYCKQVFVADSFKRPFLAYISHKKLKLIFFASLFAKIWSSDGEIIKIYSLMMKKKQNREQNFQKIIFDYALVIPLYLPPCIYCHLLKMFFWISSNSLVCSSECKEFDCTKILLRMMLMCYTKTDATCFILHFSLVYFVLFSFVAAIA